jgi:hypothetical protein
LTIGGRTMSVAEWLTWRREISEEEKTFLAGLNQGLKNFRNDLQKKGGQIRSATAVPENYDASAPPEMVINVDEKALLSSLEEIETTLGELDGKLSLINATTTLEV